MSPQVVRTYRKAQQQAAKDFVLSMEELRNSSSGEIENFEFGLNKWALESVAIVLLNTRCELINNNPFAYHT